MDDEQRALLHSRLSTGQPPPLTPLGALKNFWKKTFTYRGRASRAEYNWALTFFLVTYVGLGGILVGTGLRYSVIGVVIAVVYLVAFIVPWISLIGRRCHDLNRPGAFGFLILATGFGFLIIEGFLIFGESNPQGVRFDPPSPS